MSFVDNYSAPGPTSITDAPASSSTSGGIGGFSPLQLGTLGVGAGALGYLLSEGPSPLPSEFNSLLGNVPTLESEGGTLFGEGQGFINQGQGTLSLAAEGQLTAPQQAQLDQYRQGLSNTAAQTFASMGRNINQDTSGISAQEDIDAKVNAMAQQQIQSSIALGLGQISEGNTLSGQSLGFQNAADQALITAGQAQVQADTAYSQSLSSAFSAIGSMFGTIAGGAAGFAVGGPVGATIGASAGSRL